MRVTGTNMIKISSKEFHLQIPNLYCFSTRQLLLQRYYIHPVTSFVRLGIKNVNKYC